jgi:hypothetical protein
MTGKKTGFMDKIMQDMDKQNSEFHVEIHCIIQQQLLWGKTEV